MKALLALALLLFRSANLATSQCYYPNGALAPNDQPCNLDASISNLTVCCSPGSACTNNGVCMSTAAEPDWNGTTLYSRGSCTDKAWGNACPDFCVLDAWNSSQSMTKCATDTEDSYCCDNIELCSCERNDGPFSFTTYDIPETTIGTSSTASKTSNPTSTTMSSLTISSSTPTSSSTPSTAPVPPSTGPSNEGFVIGLALGIPAFLSLVGISWYLFHCHNKKDKKGSDKSASGLDEPAPVLSPPPGYEALSHEKPGDFEFRQEPVEMEAGPRIRLVSPNGDQVHELA